MKKIMILSLFSLPFLTLLPFCQLAAQKSPKPLSVGIFAYEGVEILDFSGPSEVFGSTEGFKPFVVAFKKEPVKAQGFITITPEYAIDDCPATDILVFPGGATDKLMNEPRLIQWIQERSKTTQILMSVCTGAGLLSKAGLLDGKEVTTFHGYIPALQKITPAAKVLSDTRFVDNGQIITTAGVSAGTDGALHVVARIKGMETAKTTAFYMEYDKWQPNAGKIFDTPFIRDVKSLGLNAALKAHASAPNGPQPLYYPGELLAASESLAAERPAESEAVLRFLLREGWRTPAIYDALGAVMSKNGKAAPPDSRSFSRKIADGEIEWARQIYKRTIAAEPDWLLFTESDLNDNGYALLNGKKSKDAKDLFIWITELYPDSPNAWDSLAECCESMGENSPAIEAAEKCLAKLAESSFDERRKKLYEKISNERIQRLKARP